MKKQGFIISMAILVIVLVVGCISMMSRVASPKKNVIKIGLCLYRFDDTFISNVRQEIEEYVKDTDIVVTGEGRLDSQTVMGKAPIGVANIAKKELENMKPLFPSGSKYEIIVDNSIKVKDAISNVTNNGLQALVIAVLVLLVFLKDLRASLVVGMSIPISAAFTFFLLNTQGISLNLISLMGLALAIGSLVDNAVVTLDNIFDHIQINKEPADVAAIRGTNEVILPMMASTATSVCVFLPIILFEGITKEVFKSIAFSMMFALSASIIVAMLWVPMASSLFLDVKKISDNAEKAANNSLVIAEAANLLLIAAIFQISDGLQVTALGALRGLQDAKVPMYITFIAYWLIAFPILYVLGVHTSLGNIGIWIGLLVGLTAAAVCLLYRFNRISLRLIKNRHKIQN